LRAIAEALDQARASAHRDALDAALEALKAPDIVPSARVLQAWAQHRTLSCAFPRRVDAHKACLTSLELPRSARPVRALAQWSFERPARDRGRRQSALRGLAAEIPVAWNRWSSSGRFFPWRSPFPAAAPQRTCATACRTASGSDWIFYNRGGRIAPCPLVAWPGGW